MRISGVKNNQNWGKPEANLMVMKKEYEEGVVDVAVMVEESISREEIVQEKVKVEEDKRERELRDALAELESRYQLMTEQLRAAIEQGKGVADAIKVRMNCLIIAMRIMAGDEVPREDYQYLAKNDPELFSKAISLRTTKENPEKHKRVSEDEEAAASSVENSRGESGRIGGGENSIPDSAAQTVETTANAE